MNYRITIERKEPNPNFEVELTEWKERNRYNSAYIGKENPDYPRSEFIKNALVCELTEEQFKAIKAQVFNTFE